MSLRTRRQFLGDPIPAAGGRPRRRLCEARRLRPGGRFRRRQGAGGEGGRRGLAPDRPEGPAHRERQPSLPCQSPGEYIVGNEPHHGTQ